jgi:hypothetical protein
LNTELLLPLLTSIAWLVLAMSALASHRLGWGQIVKMALAWLVIFGGIFVIVEWFMFAKGTASSML